MHLFGIINRKLIQIALNSTHFLLTVLNSCYMIFRIKESCVFIFNKFTRLISTATALST